MKKKEIMIVVAIVVIAAMVIGVIQFTRNNKSVPSTADSSVSETEEENLNKYPTEEAVGQWVAIMHRNQVALWFDSGVDATYTVEGDYGTMHVEVLDGAWHVSEVECPNHTCEQMGWDDGTAFTPIWCIPNNIFLGTYEWVEGYLDE